MMQVVLTQALNRAGPPPPRGVFGSILTRLRDWGGRRWNTHRQQLRHRRTVRTLSALDDRTLHDIGLERSEITSYASRGGEERHPANRFMPLYIVRMY